MKPLISVVIIGRNEGQRLQRCLESVRAIETNALDAEIIYVDSGSKDNSMHLAHWMGAQVIALSEGRCSAALARNHGWRAAKGEWILFLDGDTIVHPNFPERALAAARAGKTGVVWGHRRELYPEANFYHRVLDLDWVYAPGISEFCGGDALMLREALEKVQGFNDQLIAGEEPELCSRLRAKGYEVLHIDVPMTKHDLAINSFSQYWKRATRAGYAYAKLAWETRNTAVPMWTSETWRNALRVAVLVSILIGSLGIAILLQKWAFALLPIVVFSLLVVRSAIKASWKSSNLLTLLCYGIHSHMQQIPILFGQFSFWADMATTRRRELIEYK